MKKLLSPIAFAIFLSSTSFAQTSYPGGITGCIARWDFSGKNAFNVLPDVSGNGSNGTATNVSVSTGWQGNLNSAGVFNGASSQVRVANSTLLSPSAITIIAIVKPEGFYKGTCQDNNIIYKSFNYYQNGCWGMEISETDGDCSNASSNHVLEFAGPGLPTNSGPTTPVIDSNQWYFLAATYDGSVAKRYTVPMSLANHVTGITYNSISNIGTSLTPNNEDVFIGATQNTTFPYWFNGRMDELALFNRVLADSEIQSIYNYLWNQVGNVTINKPFTDTLLYPGQTFHLNYTVNGNGLFTSGNVFVAQLSDANGSFATPTSIGTTIDTTSGVINCTIPTTTLLGSKYRVRIVSTTPVYTSSDDGKNIQIATTGVNKIASSALSFTIYPNPGKENFILTGATKNDEAVEVVIVNSLGQVVYQNIIKPTNNKINMPVNLNCATGLYLAHIRSESCNQTVRFAINR